MLGFNSGWQNEELFQVKYSVKCFLFEGWEEIDVREALCFKLAPMAMHS